MSSIQSSLRASRLPVAPAVLMHPLATLRSALALSRQRRQLAALEPERLSDMGLSAEDARREASRPFWDAPHHWKA
jgi:uncharacterized protein YjiS (DUF1127 family)